MFSSAKLPFVRLATPADFDAIYDIWMQDHVNPFMSFEIMTKEEFKPIYDEFDRDSDIYVIDHQNIVVAVQRLSFGAGACEHIAEYSSFAVHKDYLRRGYGSLFYRAFQEIIETKHKHIKRIELSQESDNEAALILAEKMGFQQEAFFPDWLTRTTGTHQNKWYVGERFLFKLLDPALSRLDQRLNHQQPLSASVPHMPHLKSDTIDITYAHAESNDKITAYHQGKAQAACRFSAGVRRYSHIEFWDVQLMPDFDPIATQAFFRELIVIAAKQHKKIEFFTSDQTTITFFTWLGFDCQGEKISSKCVNGSYYNEVGLNFGLFTINDAKKLLLTRVELLSDLQCAQMIRALDACRTAVRDAFCENKIDDFGKVFLLNLAYQITREGLGEVRCYHPSNSPWDGLVDGLYANLKPAFSSLAQAAKTLGEKPIEETLNRMTLSRK